jgi:cysteine-S-conjugate beta-lyase
MSRNRRYQCADRISDFDSLSIQDLRRRKSSKWRDVAPGVLPAWVAELDVRLAPPVHEALLEAVTLGDTGYVPERSPELAEAFAGFACRRFGWTVLPENVCMVPDVTAGIDRIVRLTSQPGDQVAMFLPAYPPFYETLQDGKKRIVYLYLEENDSGWQVDYDQVVHSFTHGVKVLLLNNPHNPTGKVFSRAELERLLELACRHDIFVISDEIHAPLTLPGSNHTPWLTVGPEAASRSVVLTAATKAFNLAGLKCGLMVAEGDARNLIGQLPNEFKVSAGHFGALASTAAFRHGDAWLDALLDHLSRNRAILGRWIASLHPRIRWQPPQATYLAWLDLSQAGLGPDPARRILQQAKLALSPGQDFDPINGHGRLRLNFGTTQSILNDILSRITATLESP